MEKAPVLMSSWSRAAAAFAESVYKILVVSCYCLFKMKSPDHQTLDFRESHLYRHDACESGE